MSKISKKEAVRQLWLQGVVCERILDDNQKDLVKNYRENPAQIQVFVLGRQTGKSFGMLSLAVEEALIHSGWIINFIAPTKQQARDIAKTTMRSVLKDCPDEIMPQYKTQENSFVFHNGSEIKIVGANSDAIEAARGPKAHLIICDEVGFWSDLDYAIKNVLYPKLNTTKGKLIMASTPPKSSGHAFHSYVQEAEMRDALIKKTVYDCPRYTNEDIERFAYEVGGLDSVTFRREYLCQFVSDSQNAVIPEATDDLMSLIVKDWKRPDHYDRYVSMDIGTVDMTVALFGYYDFLNNKLIFEDEVIIHGTDVRPDIVFARVSAKEKELWTSGHGEPIPPYMRVSDINYVLTNDLFLNYGMYFLNTEKDGKNEWINQLRVALANQRIIISPKCKTLIFHLKSAIWKKSRKTFERCDVDHSHYDALDSSLYMFRNVQWNKNPYPAGYDLKKGSNVFTSPHYKDPNKQSEFKEHVNLAYKMKSSFTRNKKG